MKVLFLVTEDWFFCSHRLPVARAARDAGAEVYVMTKVSRHGGQIQREHFRLIPWKSIARGSTNPLREAAALMEVLRVYRRLRPDLVHHVHNKPVLYGGTAARLCGVRAVNAIAGLGHVFASDTLSMRALRGLFLTVFRFAMDRGGDARAVFQNEADRDLLISMRSVRRENTALIRGSGVDMTEFAPRPLPDGVPTVVMAARLIWKKGVREFAEAARTLKERGIAARFALIGDPDPENPGCVPESVLREWNDSGIVEWWGHRDDMADVISRSSIVCLPSSYGEGVPKVLIEAAACGRPIVTTDMPGCRDIVRDGENGLLIPPHDQAALADALSVILQNGALQQRMGARGREIAKQGFSAQIVVANTMTVYRDLMRGKWPQPAPVGTLAAGRSMAATQST